MAPSQHNQTELLLGVSGSVACYKACELTSTLTQEGYAVDVVLTETAADMIAPETFRALSQRNVYTDLFDEAEDRQPIHIDLADRAELALMAPATANLIGQVANGLADDLLGSLLMAISTRIPVLICPAMNSNMYENPFVQQNISSLRDAGYEFVEPDEGRMACGDVGEGRLAPVDQILERVRRHV